MMELVLLGEANSRRSVYFAKAAQALSVTLRCLPLEQWDKALDSPALIKIDPPSSGSYDIGEQENFLATYHEQLRQLSNSGQHFFNEPHALWMALDKRRCKEILKSQQLPVTQMYEEVIKTPAALREVLSATHWPGVFVKPRFGSAASGVLAYRFTPRNNREVLYTSAALQDGRLINTRTLRRLEDSSQIQPILERILAMDTVVERWYPKARWQKSSYDLRAVVQFGRLDYLVARSSHGPITNLQLNNHAVAVEQLGLPSEVLQAVEDVAIRTLAALPGLSYAGIDILLEAETLAPFIVEVNGQGDLLYQDIFAENRIYTTQVKYYCQMQEDYHGFSGNTF